MAEPTATQTVLQFFNRTGRRLAEGLAWVTPWKPSTDGQLLDARQAESYLGPGQPTGTMAPPDGSGVTWNYPVQVNRQIEPRQSEGTSFAALRFLADECELIRLAIETRKDQMARLQWNIVPRDPNEREEQYQKQIDYIEGFLRYPDKINDWGTWQRLLLEDLLVTDAPAVYPRRTKGGDLFQLLPFDGTTIHPLLNEWGFAPTPDEGPAYQQVRLGMPWRNYNLDELHYKPRNRRINRLYGYPPVEQVMRTANMSIRRQVSQLDFFTEGTVPASLLTLPDGWSQKQIEDYQKFWDALNSGNLAELRKIKMVPFGSKLMPIKEAKLTDEFDEWLARIICDAFSLSPTPFVKAVNRASAENMAEVAIEEGLSPLMLWFKSLMDEIIEHDFEQPDLMFQWNEEIAVSPAEQAAIDKILVDCGIKSIDEVRVDRGLDPVGMSNAIINPTQVILLDDIVSGAYQQAQQQAQQANANADPNQPDDAAPKPAEKPSTGSGQAGDQGTRKSSHRLTQEQLEHITSSPDASRKLARELGLSDSTVRYHRTKNRKNPT